LVPQVQVGGGLVEQEERGVLSEGERDPGALALAPGQLVHDPLPQRRQFGAVDGGVDGDLVGAAPAAEQALVREPAAAHQRLHRHPGRRDRRLRQQAQLAGDLPGRPAVDVGAVEEDGPRARRQQPRQAAQQRRLAAGVRADDHREALFGQPQVQALDDDPAVVGEA
jgi:hypothetical protein